MGIVFLDFSKAFDTVPHKILIEKLLKYGLAKQTRIKNCLSGWTWGVVQSSWRSVQAEYTVGPVPLNVFINDLDDGWGASSANLQMM